MSIICLDCGHKNPDGTEWCGNPGCPAYLPIRGKVVEDDPKDEQATEPNKTSPIVSGARLAASLSSAALKVPAGGIVSCEIQLHNQGTIVDEYVVQPLGQAIGWASCNPARLPLLPGASGVVILTFAPPRSPAVHAGTVSFQVHVQSTSDPGVGTVLSGSVEVGSYVQLSTEISPASSRARLSGRHEVSLANQGNVAVYATLTGKDPEELVNFKFAPPVLQVAPGSISSSRVRVRPQRWIWWRGPDKVHQFEVLLHPANAEPLKTSGIFTQSPLMSMMLAIVLIGALGLTTLGLIAKANPGMPWNLIAWLRPSPPPTVGPVLPSPSLSPSPALSPSPSPSPTPSASPTSVPRPVHKAGSLIIPAGAYADLDEGLAGVGSADPRWDIYFGDGYGIYFITPRRGVLIGVTSSAATSPDQCANAQLGTVAIIFSDLHVHVDSTLCVRTNQGRFSAIKVTGMPGSNATTATLTISYTTWE